MGRVIGMKGKAAQVALLTSIIVGAYALPTYAENISGNLNVLQDKLSESTNTINQKESEKQQLQTEIEQFKQQLQQFDQAIGEIQAELDSIAQQIQETNELIASKKKNIEVLQKQIQQRQEVIKKRLVTLQSQPKANLVADVLLETTSIADLLDNMYSLSLIFQSDKTILEDQQSDQEQLQEEKRIVEEKEAALRSYEVALQDKQHQLEQSQQEKVNAITALEQKLDQTLQEILDEEEEKRLLQSQATAIENMQKQQAASAAEANKTASASTNQSNAEAAAPAPSPQLTGSAMFIKPAAGRYSSGFGMRGSENHKGIDIASGGTVPIVAAASGTVIRSEYSSSYGNVVYISHNINGKTYTTVYAHMRSRSVQQGQVVQQGQQIGIMGNTGMSFGQHLHFEIHAGSWNAAKSNAVDPALYLP